MGVLGKAGRDKVTLLTLFFFAFAAGSLPKALNWSMNLLTRNSSLG